ncbi:unnamed protein product [Lepeophtheirus salmonis]|uniref:(salmon louse) hypothetical protein n=1 Tax=Lepeophtheirus salmonis TaxID=72036 RepID=A0A817FGA7_LEPSM|nr:unnamed protein product [Lepeophtheirus salmonis]
MAHEEQLKRNEHMELFNDQIDELEENDFIQEVNPKENEEGFYLNIQGVFQTTINKRTILSDIARIWDPLGIFAHVLIELRIDFQSLWARGIDWDTVLEEKKKAEVWKTKIKSLDLLKEVQIIRSLRPKHLVGKPEIHGFADGGE